ncbi:MAG: peptide chain release factor N(5)-glutamine methyltransferase [Polyangiales bacterium]
MSAAPQAHAARWTVRRVLTWTAAHFGERGLDSPRLDAELLIATALGTDRVGVYLELDRPLQTDELAKIRALVQRRRQHEPVAYILGHKEFFGRDFLVSPAVLIPRPDTEVLVERVLAAYDADSHCRLLDLCTGSGILALTLAAERPHWQVLACDISPEALTIAAQNAAQLGLTERITWHQGDLFAALPEAARFDIIVCNPPYIAHAALATLPADVAAHEPHLALDGGADGLDFYHRLTAEAPARLGSGGRLWFEIGYDQGEAVMALLEEAGFVDVALYKDYAGRARVVQARADAVR